MDRNNYPIEPICISKSYINNEETVRILNESCKKPDEPANTENISTQGKKSVIIAEAAMNEYMLRNYRGRLYIYGNGLYNELSAPNAYTLLSKVAETYNIADTEYNDYRGAYMNLCCDHRIYVDSSYESDRYLGFNNAILDMSDLYTVYPNDGSIFITYKLNCDLMIYETDTPVFDMFIRDITGEDTNLKCRIMEIMGLLFTTDTNAESFFYLFGNPAAGKSVLLRLITECWSTGAVSNVSINKLGGRFDLSRLEGKIMNIDSDVVEGRLNNTAIAAIKGITGRDFMESERKFHDSHTMKNTAKLVLASNYPFNDGVYEAGLERRIVEVPFLYTVPEENRDRGLLGKLLEEINGIVFKCLKHYRFLRNRNYIFTQIDTEWYKRKMNIYPLMPENNMQQGIQAFINDCCELDDMSKVHNNTLYNYYVNYCTIKGYSYYANINVFTAVLKDLIKDRVKFSRFRANGQNTNGIIGLGLKNSHNSNL